MLEELFDRLPDLRITAEPDKQKKAFIHGRQAHALRVHPAAQRSDW